MAVLQKGARVTGAERTKLPAELKKRYAKGMSIRELAEEHRRPTGSYTVSSLIRGSPCAAAGVPPDLGVAAMQSDIPATMIAC